MSKSASGFQKLINKHAFTAVIVVIILVCIFFWPKGLLEGVFPEGEPYQKSLEEERLCVSYYEDLANKYWAGDFDLIKKEDYFVPRDPIQGLLQFDNFDVDSSCYFDGIRNYGNYLVFEIDRWDRHSSHDAPEIDRIKERHILLVGTWDEFNFETFVKAKSERLIYEEIVGNHSKLIVTQYSH